MNLFSWGHVIKCDISEHCVLQCYFHFRWKGSIYKLLWPNLLLYSVLYFSLSLYYRVFLGPDEKECVPELFLEVRLWLVEMKSAMAEKLTLSLVPLIYLQVV